jgi:class 3 adenylate cyclase/tetratricopeptide (TPR) repeat protein
MPELIRDRYEPMEVVGRAAQAEVIRALDRQHDLEVALWVRHCPSQSTHQAILAQVRRLLRLRPHPGLPVVRDDFLLGDRYFLVVDWVPGRNLEQVVAEQGDPGLPHATALNHLEQMAETLEHLHAHDPPVVHGNLEPSDFILTPFGQVVLVGVNFFGSEPEAESPTAVSEGYRAPEVASGEPPTPASDVYSLAATAFTLLTGRAPAPGHATWEGLPKGQAWMVEWAIRRGLSPDPAARPRSPREFVGRLRARLESALPTGTISFLLTDIEGSTRLWDEHADAMAWAMTRHHEIAMQAIERHRGSLPRDQGEGDSIVAVFPRAADTVACALEIQMGLSTEPWPGGANIRVRMALHTGEAELREGNYRGVAVNRCARLRAVAYGGQTLLSQTTADLVRQSLPPGATLLDLGTHRLKDLAHPERVFQLCHPELPISFPPIRSLGGPGTTVTLVGETSRFIGREEEMKELLTAFEEALLGQTRLVLLAGEAGIGKSRTAVELASHAQLRDLHVLWGRCYQREGAPAYWPWVQVIRAYLHQRDPEALAAEMGTGAGDIMQIMPELEEWLGQVAPPPPLAPDAARFRLFDSFAAFFQRASLSQPLVVVLDDLHWADKPSLLLLEFLAHQLRESRILLLCTYRDGEQRHLHLLSGTLGDVVRQPITRRMVLRGLTEQEVGRFLEETTGAEPSRSLVSAVYARSEGNPFYMSEIVRLLTAEGRLGPAEPGAAWIIEIPESVREVIGRRLGFLSEECIRVLSVASVIGRGFDLDILAEVTDVPAEQLLDVLHEAAIARIITPPLPGRGSHSFSHTLIRENLYEEVPAGQRAQLHLRIGRALEKLSAHDPDSRLADLAYHFFEAARVGGAVEAVQYARSAGDRAMAQLAYEEGVRLYDMALRALEIQPHVEEAYRSDLSLALGSARWHAGDIPEARRSFQQAADIARKLDDGERLARAALGYGDLWIEVGMVDKGFVDLLDEALAVLPGADSPLRAKALGRLAMELSFSDSRERATGLSLEAVEMARRIAQHETLAYALIARRHALWSPDNLDERHEAITEALRLADAAGEQEMALRARSLRLFDLLERGDLVAADKEIRAFTQLAEDLRAPFYLYVSALQTSMRTLLDGRLQEAESLIKDLFSWAQRLQRPSAVQAAWVQWFILRREQGLIEDLVEMAKGFTDQYPTLPGWRAGVALLYSDLSRHEEARREFEFLAADDFENLPKDSNWLVTMAELAEVCAALGDKARAAILYRLLSPYRSRNVVVGFTTPVACSGAVCRHLGILATTVGSWNEAGQLFEDAIEMNTRMGARGWVAHTQLDLARLLHQRDEPGDRQRAVGLLDAAHQNAEELGMRTLAQQVADLRDSR